MSGINKKLVEFETRKIILNFAFFEELSRIEVLCEHVIFDMILFTFSVIFLQIKTIFLKKFWLKITFQAKKWVNFEFLIDERRKKD